MRRSLSILAVPTPELDHTETHDRGAIAPRLLLISNSRTPGQEFLEHCASGIRQFLGDVDEVLFVPFALGDPDGYASLIRRRFGDWSYRIASVHEAAEPVEAIRRCAALFVGGGNTFRLLKTLYDLDLLGPIRERVCLGMPFIGSSAGTNLACPTIKTTNDMPIVYPPSLNALDLVSFNINPHYYDSLPSTNHMGESREERIREFHEVNEPPVLGLREGAWLRVEGRRMALEGTSGARLFRKGRAPEEFAPGARLDFLMEPPGSTGR